MVTMNKTLTAALLATLAASAVACGDNADGYPTHERRQSDGKTTWGARIGDVCEAIVIAACESQRCQLEYFARCNPHGGDGLVEATTLELWDDLWAGCLDGAAGLVGFTGKTQVPGCERLTPYWR